MTREVVLKVEDLTVKLGEVDVLKDISFSVTKGEFVGIIGPNGAGKSTLIRAILGRVPYSGLVEIYGSVGYVPQLPTFNREFPLTVYEFVKLPVRKEHKWKEKVEKALESVGMKGFGHKLVGQLSDGQFQRIALARAIVSQPDILLLDEPESGIDEMGKAKFYELIDELRETRGVTIVMVSHDIGLIFKKCTTIMCLNKTLHCHGPSKEISPLEVKKLFGEFDIWIRSDDHFEIEHGTH